MVFHILSANFCCGFSFIMVSCFLCGFISNDLKCLRNHFKFTHSGHNFANFKCMEVDCRRSFHIFSSFSRHVLREHMSKSNEQTSSSNNQLEQSDYVNIDNTPKGPIINLLQQDPNRMSGRTVEELLSIFIASLYGNVLLPRNTVQQVVNGLRDFFHSVVPNIKNCIIGNSVDSSISAEDRSKALVEALIPTIISPLERFTTERKRMNYFNELGSYIRPQPIVIGQRFDRVKKQGIKRFQPITCEEHFIPLREVFKNFFSLDNILYDTLHYMDSLKSKQVAENFIQGSFWKSRMAQHSDRIVLPLFLYFDDFEVGNVLGSHAGIHKLGAVYISIPCLPPWRSSMLSNIFLALLFHSSDRVAFGNRVIFRPVIDELNFLSERGVQLDIPTFKGIVYFELALILGDNLGIHSLTGFIESFSANFSCRVCKVSKGILKQQCYEDVTLLRDADGYKADLNLNNASLTGIKDRCVWLDVKSFDLFQQIGADVMHDVLEGVAKYILCFILLEYTQTYKLFSLSVFNNKLSNFDFGPDNKNKPCSIEKEHISRGSLRLSSAEMLTLLRFFGIIIGDFVPRDNGIWSMYITLRKLLDILLSTSISVGTEDLLQTLVAELNELYFKLTKDTLKPKFHNLVHYHTYLKKYGPISHLWSMRFEAKHRPFKMAARTSCSRVNITLTLAMKHQLQLNELFVRGNLSTLLVTGPKRRLPSSNLASLRSHLPLDQMKSLTEVNWAMMSSIRYEIGSILATGLCQDKYLYCFLIVQNIYVYGDNVLIFAGNMLDTLGFDEHYFAYEIDIPIIERPIAIFLESLLSPIPNVKTYSLTGKKYVVLRSPL